MISNLDIKKMKELQSLGLNRRQIARAIGKTDYFVYYWLVVKNGICPDAALIDCEAETYNSIFEYADKIKKGIKNEI
jgi:hypothetical protein